jgi:hypothetical protein
LKKKSKDRPTARWAKKSHAVAVFDVDFLPSTSFEGFNQFIFSGQSNSFPAFNCFCSVEISSTFLNQDNFFPAKRKFCPILFPTPVVSKEDVRIFCLEENYHFL